MQIDMRDKPCPRPVIEAMKAIATLPAGSALCVLVDNAAACENLRKMAQSGGHGYRLEELSGGDFAIHLTACGNGAAAVPAAQKAPAAEALGMVVAIGRDRMGEGDDALGRMLLKGFIYALCELQTPPRALLFFNGGIHLALQGAATTEDLQTLRDKGCRLLVCGSCLDFYGKKDELAIGQVCNMYEIVQEMQQGSPVVNL